MDLNLYLFLAALIAASIGASSLLIVAEKADRRGDTVKACVMAGSGLAIYGTLLVLLNLGAKPVFGATQPGVLRGIGWIAFAPAYVRVIPFAIAAFMFIAAAVVWIYRHTWGRAGIPSVRDYNSAMKNVVLPFRRKTVGQQLAERKLKADDDDTFDIKLPSGDDWRDAQ